MTDPAAPVTLTNAMAHAGRDALRQAADLFGATLPEDWRETQAMVVVVYEAMTRAAAPEPPADDLAALIAACEAQGWDWSIWGSVSGARKVYAARVADGFAPERYGDTPEDALRAARQAAGAGDGAEG